MKVLLQAISPAHQRMNLAMSDGTQYEVREGFVEVEDRHVAEIGRIGRGHDGKGDLFMAAAHGVSAPVKGVENQDAEPENDLTMTPEMIAKAIGGRAEAPPDDVVRTTCRTTLANGKPCQNRPMRGSPYCRRHQQNVEEQ